jgi:hypothetical protein
VVLTILRTDNTDFHRNNFKNPMFLFAIRGNRSDRKIDTTGTCLSKSTDDIDLSIKFATLAAVAKLVDALL